MNTFLKPKSYYDSHLNSQNITRPSTNASTNHKRTVSQYVYSMPFDKSSALVVANPAKSESKSSLSRYQQQAQPLVIVSDTAALSNYKYHHNYQVKFSPLKKSPSQTSFDKLNVILNSQRSYQASMSYSGFLGIQQPPRLETAPQAKAFQVAAGTESAKFIKRMLSPSQYTQQEDVNYEKAVNLVSNFEERQYSSTTYEGAFAFFYYGGSSLSYSQILPSAHRIKKIYEQHKDPLRPNLLSEERTNRFAIQCYNFHYFYIELKGKDTPLRLKIRKLTPVESNHKFKIFASVHSQQPNKFNSDFEFDGKNLNYHDQNYELLFVYEAIYFGLYSDLDVIIDFDVEFGEPRISSKKKSEKSQQRLNVKNINSAMRYLYSAQMSRINYQVPKKETVAPPPEEPLTRKSLYGLYLLPSVSGITAGAPSSPNLLQTTTKSIFIHKNKLDAWELTSFAKVYQIWYRRDELRRNIVTVQIQNGIAHKMKRYRLIEMKADIEERKQERIMIRQIAEIIAKYRLFYAVWIGFIGVINTIASIDEKISEGEYAEGYHLRNRQLALRFFKRSELLVRDLGYIRSYGTWDRRSVKRRTLNKVYNALYFLAAKIKRKKKFIAHNCMQEAIYKSIEVINFQQRIYNHQFYVKKVIGYLSNFDCKMRSIIKINLISKTITVKLRDKKLDYIKWCESEFYKRFIPTLVEVRHYETDISVQLLERRLRDLVRQLIKGFISELFKRYHRRIDTFIEKMREYTRIRRKKFERERLKDETMPKIELPRDVLMHRPILILPPNIYQWKELISKYAERKSILK